MDDFKGILFTNAALQHSVLDNPEVEIAWEWQRRGPLNLPAFLLQKKVRAKHKMTRIKLSLKKDRVRV